MEAAKTMLGKVVKIIISLSALMGLISSILLMILHINTLPIDIMFYTREISLALCMVIVYILAARFNIKHFKLIALMGLLISIFNLVGFKILIKLLRGIGV